MRSCTELGICQARECAECKLPCVSEPYQPKTQWAFPFQLRPVLRTFGDELASEQAAGCFDAKSNRQVQGLSWAGSDFGVRAPDDGETQLSQSEAIVALRECLI